MSGEVAMIFTADEAAAWKAIEKLRYASAGLGDKLTAAEREAKKADQAIQKFAAATNKIEASPLERYKNTIGQLNTALAKGLITQQTYDSARERSRVENKRLLESMDASIKSQDNLTKAKQKTEVEMNKSARSGLGGLTAMLSGLTGMIAGYVSLGSVIQAATAAMEEQRQVALAAADAQASVGRAQQETIKNLAGLSSEQKLKALEDAKKIQLRTGFPDAAKLTEALGGAYSAVPDIGGAVSAIDVAARVNVGTPDKLQGAATGLLDIAAKINNMDAESNLSFLLQAGAISRIEDPEKVSRNFAPAIGTAVRGVPKQDPRQAAIESGGLMGTLAGLVTDTTGEKTRTAMNQLAPRIAGVFEGRKDDPGTFFGRIAKIRSDPALRKRLFKTEWGETDFKDIFKDLFDPTKNLFEEVQGNAGRLNFGKEEYYKILREQGATKEMRAMRSQAKGVARSQSSQLSETEDVSFIKNAEEALKTSVPLQGSTGRGVLDAFSWLPSRMANRYPQHLMERLRNRENWLKAIGGEDESQYPEEIATKLKSVRGAMQDYAGRGAMGMEASPQSTDRLMRAAEALEKATANMRGDKGDIDYATRGRREAATTLDRE